MGRIEKTVFISYRRTNFYTALAVYQDLTQHGYDVFFDYQSIDSGDFEKTIIESIKARAHFLVILSPSALERCKEPGDWLRREIETAIDEDRNVVPLMMEGFDFGGSVIKQALSGKLAALNRYNGLRLIADYFFEAMEKLRGRFLNVALEDIALHPVSDKTRGVIEAQQVSANEATLVVSNQLTAEEWFERGYTFEEAHNWSEAIRCYAEAIHLEPSFAGAFRKRGDCFIYESNLVDAIKDFDNAIRLYSKKSTSVTKHARAHVRARKPKTKYSDDFLKRVADDLRAIGQLNLDLAKAYFGGGIAHQSTGDLKNALIDYGEAIQRYPYFNGYYFMRGLARRESKDLKGAIADFNKAIRLDPDFAGTYYNTACVEAIRGNTTKALKILRVAIEKEPEYKEKARKDPDFEVVRHNQRFKELVSE